MVLPPEALALIRVYRIPFSTNVERVALAAGHKGVAVEWIDVAEDDRSPVEAVSGQSLVPVLVDGDEVVCDSTAIIDWLEARVPEPPLWPRDAALRDEVRAFVDWFNAEWKRPPNQIDAEEKKPEPDTALIAELAASMRGAIPRFERLLDGRDYLFGDFGVADVIAFPFLKYAVFGAAADDEDRFHAILVEHQPLDAASPIRAWANRVDAHPRS